MLCYVAWPLIDWLYVACAYESVSEWVIRGSAEEPYIVSPHGVRIANLPDTERMTIAGFSFKRSWVRPGKVLVFEKKRAAWLPGAERRATLAVIPSYGLRQSTP